MPRYKEYNEERVVKKAMNEFWLNGYGATSLSTLTSAMKINRFTFYDVFENKENLLLRTMDFYIEHYFLDILGQLRSDKNVLGFISSMLREDGGKLCGCYILTMTAETGQSIPGAVKILNFYVRRLTETIQEVVQYLNPESDSVEIDVKTDQITALYTSLPLMHSIQTTKICMDHARGVLNLMGMNNTPDNAEANQY